VLRFPLFAILVAWSLIYLPGLGSRELQGEEARRVLPGRTMIQTGEWMVPHSGGKVYNRKPPLINWLSAAAIRVTGSMDEWTARLPSAIIVLVFALAAFLFLRRPFGEGASLLTSLIILTNIGFIEKGRLIEIEALYSSLYGLALLSWLGLRGQGRPIAAWLLCGLFSGLAFLAKGPPHLIYLYLILFCVLKEEKSLRDFVRWPHLASLAVFVLTWLPWAMLNIQRNPQKDSAAEWQEQITHRLGLFEFDLTNYLLQIPQSWVNFLPWAIFLPLWFHKDFGINTTLPVRAIRTGTLIGFLIIAVLPSSRPRFMLPCSASAALLTAHALYSVAPAIIGRISVPWRWITWLLSLGSCSVIASVIFGPDSGTSKAVLSVALAFVLGMAIYLLRTRDEQRESPLHLAKPLVLSIATAMAAFASALTPLVNQQDDLRPFAQQIRQITGPDATVVLMRVGVRMWPFYLGMSCVEIVSSKERPRPTEWLILPEHLWADPAMKAELVGKLKPPLQQHPLVDPRDGDKLVLLQFSPRNR
jgi:4-amino-4-deoxy-L-arabinose transferase-like glycosyltransferase